MTTVYPTSTHGTHGNSGGKSAGRHVFPSGKGRKCPETSGNRYSGFLWELKDFDPNILLKEIIKTELGNGNNILSSSVYFVCTNDNVIFHLYDDRGADLVADKKERIINIYYNLNDLILDYDREKIDYIFKQKSS